MTPKSRLYCGVVLPNKPPIDKVAALVLAQTYSKLPIESAELWTTNDCSEEQFKKWAAEGIYPIDIGRLKYHTAGVGSATELVANDFGVIMTPGIKCLIELINDNNKDGSLKEAKFAIARMMREMYELEDTEAHQFTIINAVSDAIQAFIRVKSGEMVRSAEELDVMLPHLVKEFAACNYAPLTLGRYLRDLWILGEDPQTIAKKLHFFAYGWEEVKEKLESAKAEFDAIQPKDYFQAKGYKGIVLKTDNRFLSNAAKAAGYTIRVVVNHDGHTVIATDGVDLSVVAEKLQEMEPTQWHFPPKKSESQMTALINGGLQYKGVPPTKVRPSKIVGLLQQYVVPKKKR